LKRSSLLATANSAAPAFRHFERSSLLAMINSAARFFFFLVLKSKFLLATTNSSARFSFHHFEEKFFVGNI
jgi:hypothetical protein